MVNFFDALRVIHNASVVQNYGLLMLTIYLTDVWGVGIIHATGLINIWVGITKIMPLFFLFLMDNYIGTYSMLLISTTASAMGMGLLSISTPSRLYSLITGSCSEYNMKCITQTQQSLFYVALVLIMLGRSACAATMLTLNFKGNDDEKELRKQFVTSGSGYAAIQASLLALTPWSVVFAVPSVYNLLAISLLREKSWSHKLYISNPERSPITSVVRVIVASFSKRPLKMKRDEQAQAFVRMLPVGVMYGFFALISTTCTTYFLQQAKRLKPSLFFRMEYIEVAYIVGYLFDEGVIRNNTYNKKKLFTLAKDAMINAITCCAIAVVVELSRLRVIRNYGISNHPDEIIPMSRLWLLPQFGMLIYFVTSLDPIRQMFFVEDMSLPMKNFKVCVFEGFIGIAIIGSVLVVHLVGNISLQIMGDTTENSRSDLFYWALTVCVLVFTIWLKGFNYFNNRRGYLISQQLEERKYKRR